MINSNNKQKSDVLLNELVAGSDSGTIITIDDLSTRCSSISELLQISSYAAQKAVWIRSEKQPWFDINAKKENPMITIIRSTNLQKQMQKNFTYTNEQYELNK